MWVRQREDQDVLCEKGFRLREKVEPKITFKVETSYKFSALEIYNTMNTHTNESTQVSYLFEKSIKNFKVFFFFFFFLNVTV